MHIYPTLSRVLTTNLHTVAEREWLVTNGIGGYAAGTIAGIPSRTYHGLLVAALQPPVDRTVLLTKLDETASYAGREWPLFANRWAQDVVEPTGFIHLEGFYLEGTTPVWTFALADALLEKRVWMQPGANTTYIQYRLVRATAPLSLTIKTIVNHRNHHATTATGSLKIQSEKINNGMRIVPQWDAPAYTIFSTDAEPNPQREWYSGYYLSVEAYRGLYSADAHLYAGDFKATLEPGANCTLVASTESQPELDGDAAYAVRQQYERDLITRSGLESAPPPVRHLVLAADQFVIQRATPDNPDGRSVIAGYPWFNDWGRDTMISLPGLTLSTRRYDTARGMLRTFAHYVDQGMLPNRFPDAGETPEYNTVDATLWYFEAVRAYHAATADDDLLRDLFPVLQDIVGWHQRGTRYNIHVDQSDGLLYAGEPGVQLTWMDAKVDDWVVTPRIGKPVEINALWYNALRIMADFAAHLGQSPDDYRTLADRVQTSFIRYWNAERGYCFDVLDGPEGDDLALRPNQLFAAALHHSPLNSKQIRAIVDVCARRLYTPHGLRSLAADEPEYVGVYGGDRRARDGAYHQGTVWSWLIGPFIDAYLRVNEDRAAARSYIAPLLNHLEGGCVGSISEIFDAEPPFAPRGAFAQAWSVAELLRVWCRLNQSETS